MNKLSYKQFKMVYQINNVVIAIVICIIIDIPVNITYEKILSLL